MTLRSTAGVLLAGVMMTACSTSVGATADTVSAELTTTSVAVAPALERLLLTATATSASPSAGPTEVAVPLQQLPRGGRRIFPKHLVVMHYGTAGTAALGILGEGTPAQAAARLVAAAAPFAKASGRPVLPAFELIATIAQRAAGDDGMYSTYIPDADVARYLAAARRVKALLVLDLQPGRADFLTQARHYEKFLRQPDVGLALDAEWKLTPTQVPLKQIGATSAAAINQVSSYLAQLSAANGLPEKLLVLHQFREFMIPDRHKVVPRPGLAIVVHLDGFGPQSVKRDVYAALSLTSGPLHNGLKLFIDEDTDMFTPREAMAIRPRPELISYQ
ncbi:MAG: hypothetical protein JJD92_01340 [Frankiaceae bacterium]|nr:hypothetical protein [Frankiaceae bacterium]